MINPNTDLQGDSMSKRTRVIVFPLLTQQLHGWPSLIQLTAAEARACERAFLGGMEALRTTDYRCTCKTVGALMHKGILGRDGLTLMGRACGEALGRPEGAS